MRRFRLLSLFVGLLFFSISTGTAESPSLPIEQSQNGDIISEGGYDGHAIWAKLIGVLPAPPEIVWQLFIDSDAWNRYDIPRLIESRLVSAEITEACRDFHQVGKFYKVLGEQHFSITPIRRVGGKWIHYAFQYYNVPWPVANRWMIVETVDDETRRVEGIYSSRMHQVAGNLRTLEATLLLKPYGVGSKKTLMEYWVKTDPGSHVPRFLMRWGIKKILPQVIFSLRQEARRRYPPPGAAGKSPNSSGN